MKFYILAGTDAGYIAIMWQLTNPVWIYNRDNPISSVSSANMMISSTGSLLVILGNGDDPIELYTGNLPSKKVTATLFDSGNFVLRQGDGLILWQSFDYPTDILLPGMKLGINHKTGKTWSLTSRYGESNVASGPFRLDWDFTTKRLVVRRQDVVYWTSGKLIDYYVESENVTIVDKFENCTTRKDYNFTIFTSKDEEYIMLSVVNYPVTYDPYEDPALMRLNYGGNVSNYEGNSIASVSLCSGYDTSAFMGCEMWQQPYCRNHKQIFFQASRHFIDSHGVDSPSYLNQSELYI